MDVEAAMKTDAEARATKRLFYEDADIRMADAEIEMLVHGEAFDEVVLDRTIFYPESGGQPCDLGTIGEYSIDSVIEKGRLIIHTIEKGSSLKQGDRVRLELDSARRRDHTQQHSGQHLLSAILERAYGYHTLGFHLGKEYCTIDISCIDIRRLDLDRIEAEAESFIVSEHPFILHACNPETAQKFPIRKKLPEGEEDIRIAEIGGYDWVACCGTHVRNAGEIRCLKILSVERYKGNSRIYFISGDRAIGWMSQECKRFGIVAEALASSTKDVLAKVQALLSRSAILSEEKNSLILERARMDLAQALQKEKSTLRATPGTLESQTSVLVFRFETRNAHEALETVKMATEQGRPAVALSVPDKTVLAMVPNRYKSDEVVHNTIHLGAALKKELEIAGGKGGGGQGNFRAVFDTIEAADDFVEKVVARIS
jgi:alanyl-tRNA synthetase